MMTVDSTLCIQYNTILYGILSLKLVRFRLYKTRSRDIIVDDESI